MPSCFWSDGFDLTVIFWCSYHIDQLASRSDVLLTSCCSIVETIWAQTLRLTYGRWFCCTERDLYRPTKFELGFQLGWVLSGNLFLCGLWRFWVCSLRDYSWIVIIITIIVIHYELMALGLLGSLACCNAHQHLRWIRGSNMCNFIADDKACNHPVHSVTRNTLLQKALQVCSSSTGSDTLFHVRKCLGDHQFDDRTDWRSL